jgi:hypothetical protein
MAILITGAFVTGTSTGESVGGTAQLPAVSALLPVAGTCALLIAGTVSDTGVARVLGTPALVWIGDLSYSWYLWHWPLIVFATALWPIAGWAPPLAAALSLLPAWLSYRYVENPIRFSGRIKGRAVVALAGACIVIPIAACAAWQAVDSHLTRTAPGLIAVRDSQERSAGIVRHCYGAFHSDPAVTRRCTWTAPGSGGGVVLLGDSVATVLTEPVAAAANRVGYDATVSTWPGCPLVEVRIHDQLRSEAACLRYYRRSMRELLRARPKLVILASQSGYVWNDTLALGAPTAGGVTNRPAAKGRLWANAQASTVRRLNEAGIPVLLAQPTPVAEALPSTCAVVRILTRTCHTSRPRSAVEDQRRFMVEANERAVRGAQAAATVDFIDVLCRVDECPSDRRGTILYRDRLHLTIAGARLLTDRFAEAIKARAT